MIVIQTAMENDRVDTLEAPIEKVKKPMSNLMRNPQNQDKVSMRFQSSDNIESGYGSCKSCSCTGFEQNPWNKFDSDCHNCNHNKSQHR